MEHHAWDVSCVTLQWVHLPMFVTWKAPQLNSLVISSRCKNLHGRMEADPVYSFLVAFQNVLDFHFRTRVQFTWPWTRLLHAQLFKLEEIPDSYGLIQTAARNKRVFGMELCTHNIVGVACQDSQRATVLPIPNSHSLIIATRENPWQLSMELNCSHIVQMTLESEHALLYFIVPNLDHVIITSRNKHWLSIMETNSSDRPYR